MQKQSRNIKQTNLRALHVIMILGIISITPLITTGFLDLHQTMVALEITLDVYDNDKWDDPKLDVPEGNGQGNPD
jgi:hypothetical protein